MKILYTHNVSLNSKGVHFSTTGEYDVAPEVAEYLLSTFPMYFKGIAPKAEVKVTPAKTVAESEATDGLPQEVVEELKAKPKKFGKQ